MPLMSSEEALNSIFNIFNRLEQTINEQFARLNESALNNKTENTIEALLSGVITKQAEQADTVGKLLELLANGIRQIENIDTKKLNEVSTSIESINHAIDNFKVDNILLSTTENFVNSLNKFAEINAEGTLKLVEFMSSINKAASDMSLVDTSKATTVLDTVKNISLVSAEIEKLNVDNSKKLSDFLKNVSVSFDTFARLDFKKLQDNVKVLDKDISVQLGNFIDSFIGSISSKTLKNEDITKSLIPLSQLMNGLSTILSVDLTKVKVSLNPLKGYLIGRQIGQFISQILKATEDVKVNAELKNITNIFEPLLKLADPTSKFSILRLHLVLNKNNAEAIANFFNVVLNGIPSEKEVKEATTVSLEIMKLISNLSLKSVMMVHIASKYLTKEIAESISLFLNTIVNGIPEKQNVKESAEAINIIMNTLYSLSVVKLLTLKLVANTLTRKQNVKQTAEAINIIMNTLCSLSVAKLLTLKLVANTLTRKRAESINEFFTVLLSGNWDVRKMDQMRRFMMSVSLILGAMALSFALIVGITAASSFGTLIGSLLILKIVIGTLKSLISDVVEHINGKDIVKADSIIILLTGSIALMAGTLAIVSAVSKIATWESLGMSLAIMTAAIAGVWLTTKVLNNRKFIADLSGATETLVSIGIFVATISLSMILLTYVIKTNKKEDINESLLIISGFITGAILTVTILNLLKSELLNNAANVLLKISVVYAIIAVISAVVLPEVGKQRANVFLGGLVVGTFIAMSIGFVSKLNRLDDKKKNEALINLAAIAAIFGGIALITKTLLIPIGLYAEEALMGAGINLVLLSAMIGGVYLLSKVNRKLTSALISVTALALVYTGIALITKEILIPIGEQWDKAAYGMLITLTLTAALIGGVYLLSKVNRKLKLALISVTALAVIFGGIALITKELLIPIGERYTEALIGAGLTLLLTGIMIGAVYLLSNIKAKDALEAILATAAVAVIFGGIALITKELLIPIGEGDNWLKTLIGGTVVLGVLAIMGGVMTAVGKFADKFAVELAIGGAILTGVGIVMAILGVTVSSFAKNCVEIDTLNKGGAVFIGAATLIGVIALMGGVMAAVGALTAVIPFIAAGGVVLALVAGAIGLISVTNSLFMNLVLSMKKYKKEEIEAETLMLLLSFGSLFDVIAAAAPNPILLVKATAAIGFMTLASVIFAMLTYVVGKIKDINELATVDVIHAFSQTVIGAGMDDKNSVIGSINGIVNAFNMIDGVASAKIISMALNPIINTISKFVDVISKVATSTYLAGYDENGKPKYVKVSDTIFDDAASKVTKGFTGFITKLNKTFNWTMLATVPLITLICATMNPIMSTVGKFVDTILKASTGTYVEGYDDNGNPIYGYVTPDLFNSSAKYIVERFSDFIGVLIEKFGSMKSSSIDAIQRISWCLKPINDTVSNFVDNVLKVASGLYISGYTEDGKEIYSKITEPDFISSAVMISTMFGMFIETLGTSFDKMTPQSILAINRIRKSIGPIMDSVSSFTLSILMLASGTYIDSYLQDKEGNYTVPHFTKIENDAYIAAAVAIAGGFSLFVDKLIDTFDKNDHWWGNKTEDAIDAIGGSIKPVMEGVSSYTDAVLKLATGTYIKDYDEKGKPIYGKIDNDMFKKASDKIAETFAEFVLTIVNKFSDRSFRKNAEVAKDIMTSSVNPIIEGVISFSDALKPFLEFKKTKETGDNSDFLCLDKKFITDISTNIADSFVSFISIIANGLSSDTIKDNSKAIKDSASDVENVLTIIKKSADNLKNVMKAFMNDKNEVISKEGIAVATLYVSILDIFNKHFKENGANYKSNITYANDCSSYMLSINKTVDTYVKIYEALKPIEDSTKFIDTFTTNIGKITNCMISVADLIKSLNYENIREMTDTYLRIATMLAQTSDFMEEHKSIEVGVEAFIRSINKLTNAEVNALLKEISGTITSYTTDLKAFTTLIQTTTETVEIYVTGLEKATKAINDLDNAILSRESERNRALQTFADKVNNIADAFANMEGAIKRIDEATLLRRFDNIQNLLEHANSAPVAQTNTQTNNTTVGVQNSGGGYNNSVNNNNSNNYYQSGIPSSGRVVFEFKDKTIQGFFRT